MVSVALADLHGDVVTTVTLDGSGDVASFGEFSDYDEYGRLVTVQPDTGAATYGWLGAHERAVDDSGLILMGVRLYNPITACSRRRTRFQVVARRRMRIRRTR